MSALRLALILACAVAPLAAQVTNDECSSAQPIGLGVTTGSSVGATQSPVTGDCAFGGADLGADVWFRWQAPGQGVLRASLANDGGFADFDTVLSAFSGPCTSLDQLACNDDAFGPVFTLQSELSVPVQAGQDVLLELGGWDGAEGDFGLSLVFTPMSSPPNDECASALAIGVGVTEGTNFFATQSAASPPCGLGGVQASSDVWFHLQAPATGLLIASTADHDGFAEFDTIVAIYGGSCGALQLLACNDDAGFSLASQAEALVQQDDELWISVGAWDGQGAFGLAVVSIEGGPPPNDDCATALPVTAGEVPGTTIFAADSPVTATCALFEGYVGRDVWYAWTAPGDGLLTATTTASGGGFADFDTIVGIFAGACDSLVEVGCSDDSEGVASLVTVPVIAGETYLVEVGGWSGASGDFILNLLFGADHASPDIVLAQQKVSATQGGFGGDLAGATASFGISVAPLGDLDGDGTVDVAVGSPFEHFLQLDAGAVWVLFLRRDGTVKSWKRLATGEGGLAVSTGHTDFGVALAALGDLDGDGAPELAVGAPGDDDGGEDRGAVHVLSLAPDGSVLHATKVSDTVGGFNGIVSDGDAMGGSLAALGDVNGDGVTELAVGTAGSDDGEFDSGAVWIWSLTPAGTVPDWQKISNTKGLFTGTLDESDAFGAGVAGPGDLDLDGVPDLVVGAPGDDDGGPDHGALWSLFLRTDSKVKSHAKLSTTSGDFGGLLFDGAQLGKGLCAAGDLDADGTGDLFAGSIGDSDGGLLHGAAWAVFLRPDGTAEGQAKISEKKGGFAGPLGDAAFFGEALCAPGDVDADGRTDLIVGNRFDDDGSSNHGALWVLFLDAANPWALLGHPLAGIAGPPLLTGEGPLQGDDKAVLHLAAAKPLAPVTLFAGVQELNLPLLGGTLVPSADLVAMVGMTGGEGILTLTGRWPAGVPAGFQLYLQCWIQDRAGPQGWAASNGLQIITH